MHSVMPHMHLLGKSIKVTMTPPDGKTKTLVDINDWDYNWQETYWFKEPIKVEGRARGSTSRRSSTTAPKNPNNPFNPPKPVLLRRADDQRDVFGFLGVTTDDNEPGPPRPEPAGAERE